MLSFLNLFIRFFWDFTWWQALKMSKNGSFWFFIGKIGENISFLHPQSALFKSKSAFLNFSLHLLFYIFLRYLMTGIKNSFEVTILDFSDKFLLCPKWSKRGIFGPKILIFELFFLNLLIGFFCSIFKEKLLCPKWGKHFFWPKINTLCNFSLNLLISFLHYCTWWKVLKSG